MRYGSRKFLLAAAALVGAHVALWLKAIGPAEYQSVVLGLVGLYAAGNVAARVADGKGTAP